MSIINWARRRLIRLRLAPARRRFVKHYGLSPRAALDAGSAAAIRDLRVGRTAARMTEPPVAIFEDEVAKYAGLAGTGSGKSVGLSDLLRQLAQQGQDDQVNLADEVRANLAHTLGEWWPQYATVEEMGTAAHLAAYGLRPTYTPRSGLPAVPRDALITARDPWGYLTADSRVVVGLSSQPIPVRVAHHPYGRGEAVRINEALALMGYQPRVAFDLAGHRHPVELKVVPVRRDRAIRLARQVAALRCQVAAERTAHERTLAHLRGDDVPAEAWLDHRGDPLFF